MSKKNKNKQADSPPMQPALAGHSAEHKIIKHDLVRIVVLNVIYLAVILALYYTNLQRHYLENWAAKYIHF